MQTAAPSRLVYVNILLKKLGVNISLRADKEQESFIPTTSFLTPLWHITPQWQRSQCSDGGVSYYPLTQDGDLKFSTSIVKGRAESLELCAETSIRWPVKKQRQVQSLDLKTCQNKKPNTPTLKLTKKPQPKLHKRNLVHIEKQTILNISGYREKRENLSTDLVSDSLLFICSRKLIAHFLSME